MSEQERAESLVARMVRDDGFSAWLGLEIVSLSPGQCTTRLTVRREMLNGFGVAHGGIAYSLADSALAFASNTHGTITVSIDNAISYPAPVHEGDVLTATAELESESRRLAFYRVRVVNQSETAVAIFRGTVYRTKMPLLPAE